MLVLSRIRHAAIRLGADELEWRNPSPSAPRGPRMAQYIRRTPLIAALAATTLSAHVLDGEIAAGHSFARAACSACHVVDAEEHPPRRIFIGPGFRNIANTPGITATALRPPG
jgi:hypothetical protein